MRQSTYKYGVSAICRKLGLTVGNYISVRRSLEQLGYNIYLEDGLYKIPESKIDEVIQKLKDMRLVPIEWVTIQAISNRTGMSTYTVRRYLICNNVRYMWHGKAKIYSLKDPAIIGYLNRTRR